MCRAARDIAPLHFPCYSESSYPNHFGIHVSSGLTDTLSYGGRDVIGRGGTGMDGLQILVELTDIYRPVRISRTWLLAISAFWLPQEHPSQLKHARSFLCRTESDRRSSRRRPIANAREVMRRAARRSFYEGRCSVSAPDGKRATKCQEKGGSLAGWLGLLVGLAECTCRTGSGMDETFCRIR